MLILGFGGVGDLSADEEQHIAEQMAIRMRQLLEEHGWHDGVSCRDPVLILIEDEEISNGNEEDL